MTDSPMTLERIAHEAELSLAYARRRRQRQWGVEMWIWRGAAAAFPAYILVRVLVG